MFSTLGILILSVGCQEEPTAETATLAEREPLTSTPGLFDSNQEDLGSLDLASERKLIGPLADAYRRIDPSEDGWKTEAFSEAISTYFADLAGVLKAVDPSGEKLFDSGTSQGLEESVDTEFSCRDLRPKLVEVYRDRGLKVSRPAGDLSEQTGSVVSRSEGIGRCHRQTSQQPPISPLRSPQRRPQAPHPKSKFLAANKIGQKTKFYPIRLDLALTKVAILGQSPADPLSTFSDRGDFGQKLIKL